MALHFMSANKKDQYKIPTLFDIQMKVYELLEKERQQIEQAVDSVCIVSRRYYNGGGFGDDNLGKEITSPDITNDGNDYFGLSITGKDYYNKTFN